MHNLKSFTNEGLKEYSTWIGVVIAIIIFVCIYHKEINILIDHVLISDALADLIIRGIGVFAAASYVAYRQKNKE